MPFLSSVDASGGQEHSSRTFRVPRAACGTEDPIGRAFSRFFLRSGEEWGGARRRHGIYES
jgi:hypothetical protein